MSPTILYILKANVAISLLYLLYVALLKRDTFFNLRRYFLLFAIVFSLIFPFITVNSLGSLWIHPPSTTIDDVEVSILVGDPTISMIVDDADEVGKAINWKRTIVISTITVSIFMLFRFIVQLISIFRIWRNSNKQKILDADVYVVNQDITPFSFFKLIFINNQIHTQDELLQILLHEQTHAKQWHSIDNILIAAINILFWWNPFVWLLKREMIMNLEHLADNKVLDRGVDISDYQYHLVKLTYHETAAHLVNNFNVSQLKQRIIMMNKSKTPARKLAKYLSIIPLVLLLISVNSIYAAQNVEVIEESINAELQDPPPVRKDNDEVFVVVDDAPEFPGGMEAMIKFLSENIKYPKIAHENGIQGRVICTMVINKDGSVSDVEVARGVDPSLDSEAIRVIESMPKWKPGKQSGQEVAVRYTLPVVFRLSTGDNLLTKEEQQELASRGKVDELVISVPANAKDENHADEVFIAVEVNPEYPGGTNAMMKFLADNTKYPVDAVKDNISGRVICSFVVDKDGSLRDVTVLRGVSPSLDAEAVRVIKSMPKWKPGKQKGQEVKVKFTLPVVFRMPSEDNSNNAKFPVSGSDLMKYFADNIKYPVIAQENHIQGLVKVIFRTDDNGKAEVVQIDGDDALVKEVTRVVTSLPQSTILTSDGKPEKAVYMSSFVFRLQGDEGSNFKSYDGEMPEDAIVIVGYANSKK